MAECIYLLCALTSLACFLLLARSYWQSRMRLLLWSALCFLGFFLNNLFLFIDLIIVPEIDLYSLRQIFSLSGVSLLLFGLIWEMV
jgi:hypothetical protein